MGRPRLKAKERLSKIVSVRVTEEQRKKIISYGGIKKIIDEFINAGVTL